MATTAISKTRRSQIVEAARALYEERGIEKTTVKDITERAGITRSLFYHYFDSKDDVTNAILESYVDGFVEEVRRWNVTNEHATLAEALKGGIALIRRNLFTDDRFRQDLLKPQNAALFQDFTHRTADTLARYLADTTTVMYACHYEVKIRHVYETYYVLLVGLFDYMRANPDVSDELVYDMLSDVLHLGL